MITKTQVENCRDGIVSILLTPSGKERKLDPKLRKALYNAYQALSNKYPHCI